MQVHKGRAVAVGVLCAIAATVGIWSGPLASASGTLHSGTATSTTTHASVDRSR
jgi:hypothetical protein